MTSPAIRLARECGIYNPSGDPSKVFYGYAEELETFYAKAQAQALRDAAEFFAFFDATKRGGIIAELRRMAEELERGT